jgi:hypothetical protein
VTDEQERALRVEGTFASARELERDQPDLVVHAAEELRSAAETDRAAGTPRGRAYVRRIQELVVERPELGMAVATSLGLEHIAADLLQGTSVEGVPGIGPDGVALTSTPRGRTRRWGKTLLMASIVLLLVEAVTADALASVLLYGWTAVALALFFLGLYLIMLRE